jgi:hypothetical protein
VQPTPAPVQTPVTSLAACCTQNFATCVTYCGTTQQQCITCSDTTVSWLPQGVPPANSCIARWSACTNNVDSCCPGLTCVGNSNYAGCQYVSGPTPPPTQPPPIAPTTAPVVPPPTSRTPTLTPIVTPTIAPVVVPTVAPVPTIPSSLFSTSNTSTTWTIFQDLSSLTTINSVNPPVYGLLSS